MTGCTEPDKVYSIAGHFRTGGWIAGSSELTRPKIGPAGGWRSFARVAALFRAVPRAVRVYDGSLVLTLRRSLRVLRREGLAGIRLRANILTQGAVLRGQPSAAPSDRLYGEMPRVDPAFTPKVSVIVPSFNHAAYLPQRLDSIFAQTYTNVEVILLDDGSSDESREILCTYAERHPGKVLCRFNERGSQGVFRQWQKGLDLATGDLVWIAESDDYCSENFLTELVRFFRNPAVKLAFARTDFVRGKPPVALESLSGYLGDIDLGPWDQPFIRSAHGLVRDGWARKNIIPNVSGAIFRHPGKLALLTDPQWLDMRLCGDWIFYLTIARGGLVGYSPAATNCYRQHARNSSADARSGDRGDSEFEAVALALARLYRLEPGELERLAERVGRQPRSPGGEHPEVLGEPALLQQAQDERRPNLAMAVYALTAGGGEVFPIRLANMMHAHGYAVTLFNFQRQPTEPGLPAMLETGIARLDLDRVEDLGAILQDMGVEILHSHHAWVDVTSATCLLEVPGIRHVVTLHGMYETMMPAQLEAQLPVLEARVDCFVYTAEKNLAPFTASLRASKPFRRIENALARPPIAPVARSVLGIGEEDFLLCAAARAIPEKGWAEAIAATAWARARSERPIQLLFIGDGPELARLQAGPLPPFAKLLGFRGNVRDYFAASDLGFFPSRFKGESAPFVVIECLQAGKPALASDLGEIRRMLDSQAGPAGELFTLQDWTIPIETVGAMILKLATDHVAYDRLLQRVPTAAAKFDPDRMVQEYEAVYRGMDGRPNVPDRTAEIVETIHPLPGNPPEMRLP